MSELQQGKPELAPSNPSLGKAQAVAFQENELSAAVLSWGSALTINSLRASQCC
jgi:hypothetical protein